MMKTIYFYFRFLWFCFFKTSVFAVVDVSGSIDPVWLKKVDKLLRLAVNFSCVHVVLSDHEVISCYLYNPLWPLDKTRISQSGGGGGSQVDDAVKYANQAKADGLMIFTDGYLPAPVERPKMGTLWVIAPDGAAMDCGDYPGTVIYSGF